MVRWTSFACIAVLSLVIAMNAPGDRSVSAQDVPNAPNPPDAPDAPNVQDTPDTPPFTLFSFRRFDLTRYAAHPNVHPDDLARFPMPVVRPDPRTNYTIVIAMPDPNAHYNMPIVPPGTPAMGEDADWSSSFEDFDWISRSLDSGQRPQIWRQVPDGSGQFPGQE